MPKFKPAEGIENLSITTHPADSDEVNIDSWPYETDDPSVIRALEASRYVVEDDSNQSQPSESSTQGENQ